MLVSLIFFTLGLILILPELMLFWQFMRIFFFLKIIQLWYQSQNLCFFNGWNPNIALFLFVSLCCHESLHPVLSTSIPMKTLLLYLFLLFFTDKITMAEQGRCVCLWRWRTSLTFSDATIKKLDSKDSTFGFYHSTLLEVFFRSKRLLLNFNHELTNAFI